MPGKYSLFGAASYMALKDVKEKDTFAVSNKNEMHKARRKELLIWAKENLIKKEVFHNGLDGNISFTKRGIKEYINQPHEFYDEKNEMIKDIQNIIKKSEYMGFGAYKERISHIFEIEIKGKNSWIVAHEHNDNRITLHSISDSPNALNSIKK